MGDADVGRIGFEILDGYMDGKVRRKKEPESMGTERERRGLAGERGGFDGSRHLQKGVGHGWLKKKTNLPP